MHFSKVACLATAILCLAYTGVCTELDDGLTRVRNEVDPVTYKIDNDCAVGNNVLGGIYAILSDPNAVTCSAQAAFFTIVQPYLDAVSLLRTALSGTAAATSCLTGAAEKIVTAAVNAATGYVNCVTPIVSLIPGQLTQFQGIVTRRNAPTIVNICSDLAALCPQYPLGGLAAAINDAIDAVISLLTAIAADLLVIFNQAVQSALSIATCVVNVKLAAIQASVNIVTGIVTCAANLGVPVTPPVLPPSPEDVSAIINQALATFATYANPISALANAIANAAYIVKVLADQIVAVTADVVNNAISTVVNPFINKLNALTVTYFWNFALLADIQSAIGKLVTIQNNAVAITQQIIAQLAQQVASLKQQSADLGDELKQHVRNKGISAITACADNIINATPNYVKVCTNTLLKKTPLVTDKINGDVDVVNAASGQLSTVFKSALTGQSAIAGSQAADMYNAFIISLSVKYGIKVT